MSDPYRKRTLIWCYRTDTNHLKREQNGSWQGISTFEFEPATSIIDMAGYSLEVAPHEVPPPLRERALDCTLVTCPNITILAEAAIYLIRKARNHSGSAVPRLNYSGTVLCVFISIAG